MPHKTSEDGVIVKFINGLRCVLLLCKLLFCRLVNALWRSSHRKDINSDIIIITGGGRGLGRCLALQLAKYRPKAIVLWGRNANTLQETSTDVSELGVRCTYMICDVGDREAVYQKAREIKDTVGDVTLLINNAGVVHGKSILESNDTEVVNTMRVNSLAHFWTLKCFLPAMMEMNCGHIVFLNSLLGLFGLCGAADYCSSKHAARGLSEALVHELKLSGCDGVQVTSVYPYQIDNSMFAGVSSRFPRLIPILTEKYVCEKTVEAILMNKSELILPPIFNFMHFTNVILPTDVQMETGRFFGLDRAMSGLQQHTRNITERS